MIFDNQLPNGQNFSMAVSLKIYSFCQDKEEVKIDEGGR